MKRLTDTQVRACPAGKRISEPVEPTGSLILWHRNHGTKEWYYRRRRKGEPEQTQRLGTYPALKLVDARNHASALAKATKNSQDFKWQVEQERLKQERAEKAAKKIAERTAALGTLRDLCGVYIDKMTAEGRSSHTKVRQALNRYVLDPFPELADTKANEITADDITSVLGTMLDKGITTQTNRTRDDLHAAFEVGLKYDNDPVLRRSRNLYFEIIYNPVRKVPKQKSFERVLSRFLTAQELRAVWFKASEVMSPVYAALLRVMICTGFHPAELLRLKCSDVNLQERSIYMVQTKSGAPNLIPLNQYAYAELMPLLEGCTKDDDLFPSRVSSPKSDIYARVSVLANQVSRLRDALPEIEHFTARDFRRTVKTLMGQARISKEMRDRLQNHALPDVSSRHYDRYDYWAEKQAAMGVWERWLACNVIENPAIIGNIIELHPHKRI